jgi:hypothetical protein
LGVAAGLFGGDGSSTWPGNAAEAAKTFAAELQAQRYLEIYRSL